MEKAIPDCSSESTDISGGGSSTIEIPDCVSLNVHWHISAGFSVSPLSCRGDHTIARIDRTDKTNNALNQFFITQ